METEVDSGIQLDPRLPAVAGRQNGALSPDRPSMLPVARHSNGIEELVRALAPDSPFLSAVAGGKYRSAPPGGPAPLPVGGDIEGIEDPCRFC